MGNYNWGTSHRQGAHELPEAGLPQRLPDGEVADMAGAELAEAGAKAQGGGGVTGGAQQGFGRRRTWRRRGFGGFFALNAADHPHDDEAGREGRL